MSRKRTIVLVLGSVLCIGGWFGLLLDMQHDETTQGQYILDKAEWECVHYYQQPVGMVFALNCDSYRMKGH